MNCLFITVSAILLIAVSAAPDQNKKNEKGKLKKYNGSKDKVIEIEDDLNVSEYWLLRKGKSGEKAAVGASHFRKLPEVKTPQKYRQQNSPKTKVSKRSVADSGKNLMKDGTDYVISKITCPLCITGVGLLRHMIKEGKSAEEVATLIRKFCVHIKPSSVCEGITDLYTQEVIDIFKLVTMTDDEVCRTIFESCDDEKRKPTHDWNVRFFPNEKPTPLQPSKPPRNAPTFKVLHISDTHVDPLYKVNSNTNCKEPLCCRESSGDPASDSVKAGWWGDYGNCDIPERTLISMMKHISQVHKDIDYIILTGDLLPHDIWLQTREEHLKLIGETINLVNQILPNVPIFHALGNHESVPVNMFPFPELKVNYSMEWLYNELDLRWKKYLPREASDTIRKGAFYSVLVRPGFRIISVNTNYCNNLNWWLLIGTKDPVKELQWLIYELQAAEINNEKVHIIGHIPSGYSECTKVWSRNYYAIVERYESTITAQFFGHTHFDEFELFYDSNDTKRAISTSYIGPSVTTFTQLNPGYRIYYVDGDREDTTRAVLDHETWVMDLEKANAAGKQEPIWYKLYSARQQYQMDSLFPDDWDDLVKRMAQDRQLFDLYYKNYWRDSPLRPSCDVLCRKKMLCDLRSGKSHNRKSELCEQIEREVDKTTLWWETAVHKGIVQPLAYIAVAFVTLLVNIGYLFLKGFLIAYKVANKRS